MSFIQVSTMANPLVCGKKGGWEISHDALESSLPSLSPSVHFHIMLMVVTNSARVFFSPHSSCFVPLELHRHHYGSLSGHVVSSISFFCHWDELI